MANFQPLTLEVTSNGYATWGVNYSITISVYEQDGIKMWGPPQIRFSSSNADRMMGDMSLSELHEVYERAEALHAMLGCTTPHNWFKGG